MLFYQLPPGFSLNIVTFSNFVAPVLGRVHPRTRSIISEKPNFQPVTISRPPVNYDPEHASRRTTSLRRIVGKIATRCPFSGFEPAGILVLGVSGTRVRRIPRRKIGCGN